MSNCEVCGDNRFEIIEKAKMDLLESTNINTDKEEMQVLDNFLFRCWQMGWLEKYEQPQVKCSRREWYQKGYQDGLNADKWIPCEVELPKKRGNYLVCSKGVTWVANWFLDTWWGIEKRCRYSDVEAWMPLPVPYKKEGAE